MTDSSASKVSFPVFPNIEASGGIFCHIPRKEEFRVQLGQSWPSWPRNPLTWHELSVLIGIGLIHLTLTSHPFLQWWIHKARRERPMTSGVWEKGLLRMAFLPVKNSFPSHYINRSLKSWTLNCNPIPEIPFIPEIRLSGQIPKNKPSLRDRWLAQARSYSWPWKSRGGKARPKVLKGEWTGKSKPWGTGENLGPFHHRPGPCQG